MKARWAGSMPIAIITVSGTSGTGPPCRSSMSALIAEFNAYLDRRGANPPADGVSYKQFTLWLTKAERNRLIRDMRRQFIAAGKKGPGKGRTAYLLSPILFPS